MSHDNELETLLLKAHADYQPDKLAELYTRAADEAINRKDVEAGCFYLTQAFVYALEAGLDESNQLRKRLHDYGRIKYAN